MKKVLIHRHPHCEKCARIARVHTALGGLKRLSITTETPSTESLRPGKIMVFDLVTGCVVRGSAAFDLICRQVPLYWPLRALLWIPPLRRKIAQDLDGDHPTASLQPAVH